MDSDALGTMRRMQCSRTDDRLTEGFGATSILPVKTIANRVGEYALFKMQQR
jgi:hypothetical protein